MPDETADDAEVRRVERERRKREDELLLLLLLLLGYAERDAKVAAVHGFDVAQVIRSAVAGNAFTGHNGVAPTLARGMAQAHRDGFRRAGLMAGTRDVQRTDAGTLAELAAMYRPNAQQAADAMAQTLGLAVTDAVREAKLTGASAAGVRRAVAEAFEARGYTRANTYALDLGIERAVVGAHNAGILAAAKGGHELFTGVTVSLRHVSILDARTTLICSQRNGLTLPANDVYWYTGGCPPLHQNCRSTLRVLVGDFKASTWRPHTPPDPGFGAAPEGMIESLLP